mmetsp:Transcript_16821/g.39920  ORF Transcript_16821/g.39920 Transcript_16821/m.39920 type:complete len:101 (-) Transcript_16821:49-351(-)
MPISPAGFSGFWSARTELRRKHRLLVSNTFAYGIRPRITGIRRANNSGSCCPVVHQRGAVQPYYCAAQALAVTHRSCDIAGLFASLTQMSRPVSQACAVI